MELTRFRAHKRPVSLKDACATLESTMPDSLGALLRAEREIIEAVPIPKSPKPHPLVESWPKPRKPSYGLPWFTNEGESRRRRIASVLFREIERRSGHISPNKEHRDDTHRFDVTFFGETIEVTFRERLKMVKVPPDPKRSYSYETTEYQPTGMLQLRFENYLDHTIRREWNDTERKRVDERLREILIALYFAIEAERLRNERFRQEAARRAAEDQRRWEREERERQEREAVQMLLNEAKAWDDAERIRTYVDVVRKRGHESDTWMQWALGVADKLEPTRTRK
jgi:hypothetical protein